MTHDPFELIDGTPRSRRLSDMTAAEVRSILEATGHSDDTDAARALGMSRSMIQKLKSGDASVTADTADQLHDLQDAYADARDAQLDAAPTELRVWRADPASNEASWEATGRPSRWHRMIAAQCHQEHGTRIGWVD